MFVTIFYRVLLFWTIALDIHRLPPDSGKFVHIASGAGGTLRLPLIAHYHCPFAFLPADWVPFLLEVTLPVMFYLLFLTMISIVLNYCCQTTTLLPGDWRRCCTFAVLFHHSDLHSAVTIPSGILGIAASTLLCYYRIRPPVLTCMEILEQPAFLFPGVPVTHVVYINEG